MKWVLFFLLCTGLTFCILMIVYEIASRLWLYREFRFLSKAFNFQYKALRPFLEKEMSDEQIYAEVKDDPDVRDILFFKSKLYILFTRKGGVICENTAKTREYLLKAAYLIENMEQSFEEKNIVFVKGIFEENQTFFEELKKICKEKGEPIFYSDITVEDDNDEDD